MRTGSNFHHPLFMHWSSVHTSNRKSFRTVTKRLWWLKLISIHFTLWVFPVKFSIIYLSPWRYLHWQSVLCAMCIFEIKSTFEFTSNRDIVRKIIGYACNIESVWQFYHSKSIISSYSRAYKLNANTLNVCQPLPFHRLLVWWFGCVKTWNAWRCSLVAHGCIARRYNSQANVGCTAARQIGHIEKWTNLLKCETLSHR